MKDKFKNEAENIEIWTDLPSSQFKNKFFFAYVRMTLPQMFDLKFSWSYSATSHGKGAVDGIGATMK